jgi:hypothetical protein
LRSAATSLPDERSQHAATDDMVANEQLLVGAYRLRVSSSDARRCSVVMRDDEVLISIF